MSWPSAARAAARAARARFASSLTAAMSRQRFTALNFFTHGETTMKTFHFYALVVASLSLGGIFGTLLAAA